MGTKFVQGATDSLLGGVLGYIQSGSNFVEALVFEKAEHDGVLLPLIEPLHGIFQQRSDSFPHRLRRLRLQIEFGMGHGLTFPLSASALSSDGIFSESTRGAVEPARQGIAFADGVGCSRQANEDRLGNILSRMCIPNQAESGGINQVD